MSNVYEKALAAARRAEAGLGNCMHGWAVLEEAGEKAAALIVLSYVRGGEVDASVVWSGEDPNGAMPLLARHLNEKAGAGPEFVQALLNVYQRSREASGLLSSYEASRGSASVQ